MSYKSKVMSEIESRSLKKKTYIERIQNCMDSAKVCEETSADKDALSCDKGRFSLFFRCAGFKKDERTVAPVDSDYH